MDTWVTALKDYGFPVFALVLGYLFGKWESERRRKWEIEDRDYKRRIEIHDMRIKEAREFVFSWRFLVLMTMHMCHMLRKGENKQQDILVLRDSLGVDEILQATKDAERKQYALDILKDDELIDSARDIISFSGAMLRVVNMANDVSDGGVLNISKEELVPCQA